MKNRLIIIFILILLMKPDIIAQDNPENQQLAIKIVKLDFLPFTNMKDNFIELNSVDFNYEKNAMAANLNSSDPEEDDIKLTPGIYYFAGAAVLAAVIYFLVPDNDPPSQKNMTFGFPVTPK